MSIVHASSLTMSELLMLGNNVVPIVRKDHREVDAVNRSLHPKEIRQPLAIAPLPAIRRA